MNSRHKQVYLALLLAFAARLAMYPFSGIENPAYFEYGDIANHLVNGDGYMIQHWGGDVSSFVPTAWMPPGQVMVIAAFFALFGNGAISSHLIFLLNALLGVLAVYLIGRSTWLVTKDLRIERVALFAAALYPPFISASSTWGVASSVLFLNSLLIYCALRFSQSISSKQHATPAAIAFGVVGGILALFRAEAPLSFCFMLVALCIYHRHQFAYSIKKLVLTGLVMISVMSPWMIVNYVRFDALILGSTSGGFNLWKGNNPTASGGGWRSDGKTVWPSDEIHRAIFGKLHHLDKRDFERAYSSEMAKLATEWVRDNPSQAAILAVKKALLIWVVDLYHPSKLKYLYALFQLAALASAIYGLLSLRRQGLSTENKRWLWIVGGACLATTLLTMVFFSLPRYQIFLVGLYFPLVAIGLHAMLRKWGLLMDGIEYQRQGQN